MTNPKQIPIFEISMTKTLWPICMFNCFGHLDIGILDLPFDLAQGGERVEPFGAWYLEFGIYSLRMRLGLLKHFPQKMLTLTDHD
jgi:hypothetical protein